MINETIRQQNNPNHFELMIDSLYEYEGSGYASNKLRQINSLMKMLYEKGETLRAKEIFYKYLDFFEKYPSERVSQTLIGIYFFAGQRKKAEDLAESSKDKMAMYDVVFMYHQYAPHEEGEIARLTARAKKLVKP